MFEKIFLPILLVNPDVESKKFCTYEEITFLTNSNFIMFTSEIDFRATIGSNTRGKSKLTVL